ncbi:MAG: phosphoenolpyruvate carboxykinase (GTP) [Planctomycetes bacterium]|nr:phosphoenolpyruvate carboxykinase (GTP) [Planctomycetota bacterium]
MANFNDWVKEVETLCSPRKVVWIDGSAEQVENLKKDGFQSGEIIELNQDKLPGCFYHRSNPNDVARTEELTFICTSDKESAGPTNNWMAPKEAYTRAKEIFKGSMDGKTMYVIPFSMGPVGSQFSKIGIQVTDSIYVVLNMLIMTRVGKPVMDLLSSGAEFTKCLHSLAGLDEKKRLILHFPEDNTIWSAGSGYGGNALLGKKCLALRIASYLAKNEGWLAEHMLITGIEDPQGNVDYIAAAFPSACGKTNLAMILPPEEFERKGYKVWTVGDDIAWLRVGSDGRLWAVNPEAGFFGVAPGTNSKSNPNMMKTISRNTIFTNVALKDDKTVWWEGCDEAVPDNMTDWLGNKWNAGSKDKAGKTLFAAHPNSRFTAPISQCPCLSPKWSDSKGVPISAIIFGARRSGVVPLVYESHNWTHGVYMGATMRSERTAAQSGKVGELRRDPMAMIPFCGYNMADYFNHWIDVGDNLKSPPKIFQVNWFRKDAGGQFMWPGFGENFRVLLWMLARCKNKVSAAETPIGLIPKIGDIDAHLSPAVIQQLLSVNNSEWESEIGQHNKFFEQFGTRLSERIWQEQYTLQEQFV